MKAIILAGGKGTRLRPLTKDKPKPMIKIDGKPILEHHLELLKKHGIEHVILTVNYKYQVIEDHFRDGSQYDVEIEYLVEEHPLGTAGGLKLLDLQDTFLVLYGDVLINMDLTKLLAFHKKKKAQATLVVHESSHYHDSDVIHLDEKDRITRIVHRPKTDKYGKLTNAGLYVLEPDILEEIPFNKEYDFAKDLFPALIKKEYRMYGYDTDEYLKDMGTKARLKKVKEDVKDGRFARGSLSG